MSDGKSPSLDPAEVGETLLTRRKLIGTGAAGLAAAMVGARASGSLAALRSSGAAGRIAAGTVTFGSNYSDPLVKSAMASVVKAFEKSSGINVKVNTVDHNTFQEQISTYLQGTPQDVFTWFAGYRMQFFAAQGLAGNLDDVWKSIGANFTPAIHAASKGTDGHYYFVPFDYYPWGVFYRKSVFKQHGYTIPKTWDSYIALLKQMKKDGLTPLSFADKDGWPVMGTFDYINMRTNGYEFHINLMHGKEAWDSPKVRHVFKTWTELFPYYQTGALGRIWQDSVDALANKQTGLIVMGTDQVSPQFLTHGKAVYNDLDMFAFPEINPAHGQDSVEAPIDGFMLARHPKDSTTAATFLKFLASPAAEHAFLKPNPSDLGANKHYPVATYNGLQKKALHLIGSAKHISQFMDRDSRPDFVSTVMLPALQHFVGNPKDINSLTSSIQKQKKAIFGS